MNNCFHRTLRCPAATCVRLGLLRLPEQAPTLTHGAILQTNHAVFLPHKRRTFGVGYLAEGSLIKRAALVDPAMILGLYFIAVSGASVGLKHERFIRFQHAPLGFFNGLVEGSACDIGIQLLYKRRGSTPSLLAYIHRANEILHLNLCHHYSSALPLRHLSSIKPHCRA